MIGLQFVRRCRNVRDGKRGDDGIVGIIRRSLHASVLPGQLTDERL